MKLGIVGSGAVGAPCMFALALRGSARDIVLVNRNRERARGAVADVPYGAVLAPYGSRREGDYYQLRDEPRGPAQAARDECDCLQRPRSPYRRRRARRPPAYPPDRLNAAGHPRGGTNPVVDAVVRASGVSYHLTRHRMVARDSRVMSCFTGNGACPERESCASMVKCKHVGRV
jgi:hypothetical protein